MSIFKVLVGSIAAIFLTGCSTTIQKSILVDADSEKVWQVLGNEYAEVDRWASSVPKSTGLSDGNIPAGASVNGRVCQTELGNVNETIVAYDATNYILAYEAKADGMPFFVNGLENQWSLDNEGTNQTRVNMDFKANLWPVFNVVMWPFMKGKMNTLLQESIEELKYYVENDKPHPRKLAKMDNPSE